MKLIGLIHSLLMIVLPPDLVQILIPARGVVVKAVVHGVLLVIVLVIVLSRDEIHEFLDGHRDGFIVTARLIQVFLRLLGSLFLSFGAVKEDGPVMGAPVHELAVGVGGVDLSPEHIH